MVPCERRQKDEENEKSGKYESEVVIYYIFVTTNISLTSWTDTNIPFSTIHSVTNDVITIAIFADARVAERVSQDKKQYFIFMSVILT